MKKREEQSTPASVTPAFRTSTPATILEVDDSYASRDLGSQFICEIMRCELFNNSLARKKTTTDGRDDTQPLLQERDEDSEKNKYKRRPFGEWISRYLRFVFILCLTKV